MILYHFTDVDSLAPIMRHGLRLANLNLSRDSGAQPGATWLTTSTSPKGHGLTFGEPVTDWEQQCHRSRYGTSIVATHWPDKSRVRIQVVIPSMDRKLARWMTWHGKRTDVGMFDLAQCSDANRQSSRSWYLYFGIITPDRFAAVEVDGVPYNVEAQEAA